VPVPEPEPPPKKSKKKKIIVHTEEDTTDSDSSTEIRVVRKKKSREIENLRSEVENLKNLYQPQTQQPPRPNPVDVMAQRLLGRLR